MVKNESIEGFLGRLSSESPTPGGGGAGALSGAIGCALGRMVAHLTIGRKKYAEAEERMIRSDEKLAILEETFLQLADRDEEAFQHFMDAMKRPKETEEEKTARKEAMSIALKDATEVPLAVMETALEAFPEVHSLAISGNKNAVSDAGAAANMLLSALETGAENVRINLASMKDEAIKDDYERRMESALRSGRDALEAIRNTVRSRVEGTERKTGMKEITVKYFNEQIERLRYVDGKSDWIDLRAAEEVTMKAGEMKLIPLGVAMALPEGYEAWIVPRSSTFKNFGILQANSFGVVDESYSGDGDQWYFPAYAVRDTVIHQNDRICQFRIMKHQPELVFNETDVLENETRGGFGSTGVQ